MKTMQSKIMQQFGVVVALLALPLPVAKAAIIRIRATNPLKTAVWAGLGLLFLTAIDSRADVFTFDNTTSSWFDPGEFTPTNNGGSLYTITNGFLWNWGVVPTGNMIAGVTGIQQVAPGNWSGATWTAPQGQIITSVAIYGGNYLGPAGNMGYGVFGGATTADTEYYRGQGSVGPHNGISFYADLITVNIPANNNVAVLQLRSFWNQSATVTEEFSTYPAANNACGYMTAVTITTETVPEPATMGLLALGGLFVLMRRKR